MKSILIILLMVISAMVYSHVVIDVVPSSNEYLQNNQELKDDIPAPPIKYLKATDQIDGNFGFPIGSISDPRNFIISIKARDKNHVKVVSRRYGVYYPDLEYINYEILRDKYIGKKDGKYGVIDTQSKIIIPFKYNKQVGPSENESYYYFYNDKKMGLITKEDKECVPCEYSYLRIISNKYILAVRNNSAGIIDFENNIIIPFEYRNIHYVDDDFICANKIIKMNNNVVTETRGYLIDINNNVIHEYDYSVFPLFNLDNYDKDDYNFTVSKKILRLQIGENRDNFVMKLINIRGEELLDISGYMYKLYDSGIVFFGDKDKEKIVVNYDGDIIYKGKNKSIGGYLNSFTIMDESTGLRGLIDKEGNTIIDCEYNQIKLPLYESSKEESVILEKIKTGEYKDSSQYFLKPKDVKYIVFSKPQVSIVVNLETLEKVEYDKPINMLYNDGQVSLFVSPFYTQDK